MSPSSPSRSSSSSSFPSNSKASLSFALALLRDAASVLEFPIASACSGVYFYRAFLKQQNGRHQLQSQLQRRRRGRQNVKHSLWFELECIVTTCLYLASKVEDTARRVSDVCNVVRRCRLRLQKEAGEEAEEVKEEEKKVSENESNDNEVIVVGESYTERKDVILELERDVLRALGFQLHRTPQPHKYALALVKRRFGEEAKAATKVEVALAESVSVILEAVLFGDNSDVDDGEKEVSEWEVKRVAVAAAALAEEMCGVRVKPKCAWEELLGLGGVDVQGGDDKNGIDPERTITATTATTTNDNGCKEVMIRMHEDVKVLKEACMKYESLR